MSERFYRRESDKVSKKIIKLSSLVAALMVIGGAFVYVASAYFVTVASFNEEILKLQCQQNETEKKFIGIESDIKYIVKTLDKISTRID